MITGFAVGTEVKWNHEETLHTGVVVKVFRESGLLELDGLKIYVKVTDHSPSYLIRHNGDSYIVLPHDEVMAKNTNLHT